MNPSRILALALLAAQVPFGIVGCMEPGSPSGPSTAPTDAPKRTYVPAYVEKEGETLIKDPVSGELYPTRSIRRAMPLNEAAAEEAVGLAKTAGPLYSAYDGSGQVEVRVWECITPTELEIQSLACNVDPGYVLVGGGARTFTSGPGAFLTEARPLDWGLVSYVGASKSHLYSSKHHLKVYAIGMRLAGLSREALLAQTGFHQYTGEKAESPISAIGAPYGTVLIGGGAKVNWSGSGNMLMQSHHFGSTWYAAAKSHKSSSPATVTTYAISLVNHIPNWGKLEVQYVDRVGSVSGSGWLISMGSVSQGWVLTAPGAISKYNSGTSGRMLVAIVPTDGPGGLRAYSKDHITSSAGALDLWFIQARKAP